ncbi:MAG: hypothetical protein HYW88_00265 [Candidatus Sungbacteria bacterium]|nr:hypothetical protein [Candidatus Sungbacteria bacterium]
MSKKHKEYDKKKDANLFYCFTNITEKTKPRFFIVPAKIVAKYIRDEFNLYQQEKKKEGKKAKDVGMRNFRIGTKKHGGKLRITPAIEQYEDNWEFKK